jgi:glutathione S-transferase
MKLYYVPQTRAGRARWMLEELEVPHELVRVDVAAKQHKSPDHLRIHPLGHVPALVDGELTMFESAAIVAYLADKFPEKRLAPPPGSPPRGLYYQWLFYAMTELEPHCSMITRHTPRLPEPERIPAIVEVAQAAFHANAVALEQALADGRQFLLGEFSAVDVVVGGVLAWARALGLLAPHPSLEEYSKRLAGRPAARRARAD